MSNFSNVCYKCLKEDPPPSLLHLNLQLVGADVLPHLVGVAEEAPDAGGGVGLDAEETVVVPARDGEVELASGASVGVEALVGDAQALRNTIRCCKSSGKFFWIL